MTTELIDQDLANKTIALIPDHAWTQVRQAIVTALVDCMPGSVLERITGSYDDFDQAEVILNGYYSEIEGRNAELIQDAFKIMGDLNTLDLLNSLNIQQDGISETGEE